MNTSLFRGSTPRRQTGATLLVGLIMLVLMTLVALSAFNLGQGNLQIIGNTQYRAEAIAAADAALQEVMSNPDHERYATKPFADVTGRVKTFDSDGDGTKNVSVTITATCTRVRIIPNNELTPTESMCLGSAGSGTSGTEGTPLGNSACGEMLWNIKADAVDNTVRASASVTEGVAVRPIDEAQVATACP